MPETVRIYEVGPRDGLQNESGMVPIATKVRFIELLADAGLREIEATSFVSPSAIPQLADADELLPALPRVDGIRYPVLVPNLRGLDRTLYDTQHPDDRCREPRGVRSRRRERARAALVGARVRVDGVRLPVFG